MRKFEKSSFFWNSRNKLSILSEMVAKRVTDIPLGLAFLKKF